MSKVPDLKRISTEDFPAENQALVSRLAFPINSFMEQVRALFNKSIDFDNLNQELVNLSFTTNSDGQPLTTLQFRTTVTGRIRGVLPISLKLQNNSGFVTSAPFVNFIQNERIITIPYIVGLNPGTRYEITLLVI